MTIPPFDPVIRDGRMYGRGTCDTKAGLATMMHALASLKEAGITPPCEVLLAAVVDEEYSYRGVVRLCQDLRADAAIVAEPTELRAVIATKGVLRCRITVHGRSAHSSKPHLGINAITQMARLITAIEEDSQRLQSRQHPLTGHGTCNIGVITGGVQVNFVPDRCSIELDRRLLPGESAQDALTSYRHLLAKYSTHHSPSEALPHSTHHSPSEADAPSPYSTPHSPSEALPPSSPPLPPNSPSPSSHLPIHAELEDPVLLIDEALDTPPDSAVMQTAAQVLTAMGLDPAPCGVPFGCDASKLSRAGIPSIVFGPGSIDRAHTADEYVELDQVEQAAEFQKRFLLSFT